ncbi:MAG: cysteine desulfurase [Syntrophomonadaceae bacterium]|nr:cysteine desulfurase [Syntrophomonadaceae bacterium]
MTLYLDYNASTPVDPRVLEVMFEAYRFYYGNASSHKHVYGQKASALVQCARRQIASILDVGEEEVIFTSGATESNNLAILGLARWGMENNRKHIVTTPIEHKSVLEPIKYLASQGFEVEQVSVGASGRIEADEVISRVRPDTLLVSVMHANNETGVIQPVKEIGEYLINTDTYFHVDAAQTFGKLVDELKELKYDLLSISAHKVYGPQGVGALIRRRRKYTFPHLEPLIKGGGQEKGLRSGTLPVALIAGFGHAAALAAVEYEKRRAHDLALRESVLAQLACSNMDYVLIGDQDHVLSHTLSVSFPNIDSDTLILVLKEDVAISTGSACTSDAKEPSHVLTAMGLPGEIINGAVRISWGPGIDEKNLKLPLEKLQNLANLRFY